MDITTYALLKKSIDGVMDEVDTKTAAAAEAWLEDNIDPESGYALDRSLSLESAAAPADLVGAIGDPITDNQIDALFS